MGKIKNNFWRIIVLVILVAFVGAIAFNRGRYVEAENVRVDFIDKIFENDDRLSKVGNYDSYNLMVYSNKKDKTDDILSMYKDLVNNGYDSLSDYQKVLLFENQAVELLGYANVEEYRKLDPFRVYDGVIAAAGVLLIATTVCIVLCAIYDVVKFNKLIKEASRREGEE